MLATPSQQPVDPSITAWEKIWNLSVPCKVRNFIWRSCRNAIPTKTNLVRKCVIDESKCTQCHNHQEDVLHTLWYCPNLSQVWDSDPQWNFRGQTSFGNFQQLLSYVLQIGCNVELFTMMVWTIWFRHNTIQVNPTGFPVDQVLQQAIDSLLEF